MTVDISAPNTNDDQQRQQLAESNISTTIRPKIGNNGENGNDHNNKKSLTHIVHNHSDSIYSKEFDSLDRKLNKKKRKNNKKLKKNSVEEDNIRSTTPISQATSPIISYSNSGGNTGPLAPLTISSCDLLTAPMMTSSVPTNVEHCGPTTLLTTMGHHNTHHVRQFLHPTSMPPIGGHLSAFNHLNFKHISVANAIVNNNNSSGRPESRSSSDGEELIGSQRSKSSCN